MNYLQELVRTQQPAKIYLPRWVERLADLGITSTDPQLMRRQRLTNIFSYASAFCAVSQLIVGALQEFAAFLILHTILATTAIALLFIHRLHRYGPNLGAHMLVAIDLSCLFAMTWGYGRDSQIYVYYTLAGGVLILIFGMEHWRTYAGWIAVAVAGMLVLMKFSPREGLFLPENHALRELIAAHAFLNTLTVMAFMVFFTVATLRKVEIGLQAQYVRSSALMHTVFPAPIVARLTSGQEERIADRIEGLTVLFADLVGFTKTAHDLPPEEIIGYLDGMVRCFDRLCAENGVEKIKTIGDRYMAVGGLTGDSRGQAVATGKLALAILQSQADLPALGGKHLALRIGLHTGSATAGIIGDTRFTYDVWGDAVNMASRMESHSLPGRIQVSEAFRSIVQDAFCFDERGIVEIRGIGPTRTWFLGHAPSATCDTTDVRLG
jgi:adenylate cyclase